MLPLQRQAPPSPSSWQDCQSRRWKSAALTSPPTQPPIKIKGVKATLHKGTAKITWKAVASATSYQVRFTKPGGTKYEVWKTTTERVFKIKVKMAGDVPLPGRRVNAAGRGPVAINWFKGK